MNEFNSEVPTCISLRTLSMRKPNTVLLNLHVLPKFTQFFEIVPMKLFL